MAGTRTIPAMQERPLARILYALTALSAFTGITIGYVYIWQKGALLTLDTPGLFDDDGQNAVGRLADLSSYFTQWSNVLVVIVFTLLAIRTVGRGRLMQVLLFTALLMIVNTGLIYNAIIAPAIEPRYGWDLLSTTLVHTVTPLLVLLSWVLVGPRGWVRRELILPTLILPSVWLVYTLMRGAVTDAYPYGFVNASELGYPPVLGINAVIMLGGIALCFLLIGIDRLARRWTPA